MRLLEMVHGEGDLMTNPTVEVEESSLLFSRFNNKYTAKAINFSSLRISSFKKCVTKNRCLFAYFLFVCMKKLSAMYAVEEFNLRLFLTKLQLI